MRLQWSHDLDVSYMILIIIMDKLMVQHLYSTATDNSLCSPEELKSVKATVSGRNMKAKDNL